VTLADLTAPPSRSCEAPRRFPAPVDRRLLAGLLRANPFQPATCFWRAVEVGFVADRGLPEGNGLDLACGDGRLMGVLLERVGSGRQITGLDVDELEIASARSTGIYTNLVVASAADIPAQNGSFDWVFSNSALEHIEPIDATLREVGRVLRPAGRFVFTVPSEQLHDCLSGPLWGGRTAYLEAIDRRSAHLRYWNADEWREALDRAGLDIIAVERYLTEDEVRRWETLSRWTAGLLYALMRRPPIEIQRQLGMRGGQRLPGPIARALAGLLTLRVRRRADPKTGCLYISAERR
jgi:ubiquinone/menaquinone biosynthesis C-methylase UbiE